MPNDELLLSTGQVALLWNTSARTVQRMVKSGKLHIVQKISGGPHGIYLFRTADIVPPKIKPGESPCMVTTSHPANSEWPVICNAIAGHKGPHAAYSADSCLIFQWPQGAR